MNQIKPEDMTEKEVRRIAREESQEIFEKSIGKVTDQIKLVRDLSEQNQKTLARLERLLLGEMGVDKDDTLKARATYAYQYAKRNSDLRVVERAIPALQWFEDWNKPEVGCDESKMESLGTLITFYNNLRWFLALLGVTTLVNAIPAIKMILDFIEGLS
jgi:glycerol-3-phosphate dehydrogenase